MFAGSELFQHVLRTRGAPGVLLQLLHLGIRLEMGASGPPKRLGRCSQRLLSFTGEAGVTLDLKLRGLEVPTSMASAGTVWKQRSQLDCLT